MPTVRATFPGWPGRETATITNDDPEALRADLDELDRQYGEWKQGQATQARAKENLKALPANEPYASEEDKPSLAAMAITAPIGGLKRLPGVALGMLGAPQQIGAGIGSVLGRSIGGETLFSRDPLDQTDPEHIDPRAQFQNIGQSDQEFALQQPVTRGLGPDKGKAKPLFAGKGFGEVPQTGMPLKLRDNPDKAALESTFTQAGRGLYNALDLTEEARFWNEFRRGPKSQEEYKAWLASRSLTERISPIEANPDGILPYRLNLDAFRNYTDALESLPEMGAIALATAYGTPATGLGLGAALGAGHAGEANLNLQDKQRMIANPEQQAMSVGAGVLSGLSESLPIGHMLGGASKVASPLRRVGTGFGEEAIQEAGSKVLEDAASADPEQQIDLSDPTAYLGQLLETGLKAGLMGGGFAGAVDAAPAMMRERKAGKALKELQGIANTPADIIEGVDGTQGMQPVDMSVAPAAEGQAAPDPAQEAAKQAQLAELKDNWEAMMRGESTATFFPAGAPAPRDIPEGYRYIRKAPGLLVYHGDSWAKGIVEQEYNRGPEGIAAMTQRTKAPAQAAPPPPLLQPQPQAAATPQVGPEATPQVAPTTGKSVPASYAFGPDGRIVETWTGGEQFELAEPTEEQVNAAMAARGQARALNSGTNVPAAAPAPAPAPQQQAATESVEDLKRHQATLEEQRDKLKKLIGPKSDPRLAATLKNVETALGANEKKLKDALRKGVVEKHLAKAQAAAQQPAPPPQQAPQAPAPADIIEGVDGTQGMQPVDMQVQQPPLVKPARAPKDARQDKRLFDVRQRAAGKTLPPEGPPPPPEAPRPTKPLASRAQAGATQTRTASVEDTERVLEIARRAFPGFNFKSIDDIKQASPAMQTKAAQGSTGKAWIEGNTATVLRTANEGAQDVANQILHEFGHKAVELAVASGEKGDRFHASLMRSEWGRKAMQKWVDEWHESYEIDKSIPLEKQDEEALDLIANETIAKLIETKLANPDYKTPPWYAGVRATARHRLASWRDAFSTSNGKPLADWYVNSLSEKDIDGLLLKGLRQARRGASVGPAGADDDPDFSRAKRRQKDLLATHGISGERLLSILRDHDGELPAPSIAITRGAKTPDDYPGWKIIFPSDTINPEREFRDPDTGKVEKPNIVRGADAYSPMVTADIQMPASKSIKVFADKLRASLRADGSPDGRTAFAIGAALKSGAKANLVAGYQIQLKRAGKYVKYIVESPSEVVAFGEVETEPNEGFVSVANGIVDHIKIQLQHSGVHRTMRDVVRDKAKQSMSFPRSKPDEWDDDYSVRSAKLISQPRFKRMEQVIDYSKRALPGIDEARDRFAATNDYFDGPRALSGARALIAGEGYGGGKNGVVRAASRPQKTSVEFYSQRDENSWNNRLRTKDGAPQDFFSVRVHDRFSDTKEHLSAGITRKQDGSGWTVRLDRQMQRDTPTHRLGEFDLPANATSSDLMAGIEKLQAVKKGDPKKAISDAKFIRDFPTTILEATPVRVVNVREAAVVVAPRSEVQRRPEVVAELERMGIQLEVTEDALGQSGVQPRTSDVDRAARARGLYFSRGKNKLPSGDPGDPGWAPARPAAEPDVYTGEPTDTMASTNPERYSDWRQQAARQSEEPEESAEAGPGKQWDPAWGKPTKAHQEAMDRGRAAAEAEEPTSPAGVSDGREFRKSAYQKEVEFRAKRGELEADDMPPMRPTNPNAYTPVRPDGDSSPKQVSPANPERVSDREVATTNRWTPEQLERAKAAKESGRLTEREYRPRMPLDPAEESANDTKRTSPVRMLDANKEIYNALKGNVVGRAVASTDETDIDTTKQAIDPEFEPREARAGFGMVDYDMVSDEIKREIQQLIDSHQPGAEVRGVKPGQTGVIALPHGGKATVALAAGKAAPSARNPASTTEGIGYEPWALGDIVHAVAEQDPASELADTVVVDLWGSESLVIEKNADGSVDATHFTGPSGTDRTQTIVIPPKTLALDREAAGKAVYDLFGFKPPPKPRPTPTLTITGRGGIEATASLDEALAAEEAERQRDEEQRAKESGKKPNPWAWDIDPKEHAELLIDAAARKFLEAAQADSATKQAPSGLSWNIVDRFDDKKFVSEVTAYEALARVVHGTENLAGFHVSDGSRLFRVFLESGPALQDVKVTTHVTGNSVAGIKTPQASKPFFVRKETAFPDGAPPFDVARKLIDRVGAAIEDQDVTDETDSGLEALPKLRWSLGMDQASLEEIMDRFDSNAGATLFAVDDAGKRELIVKGLYDPDSNSTVITAHEPMGFTSGGKNNFTPIGTVKVPELGKDHEIASNILKAVEKLLYDFDNKPKREIWPDGYENDPAGLGQFILDGSGLQTLQTKSAGMVVFEPTATGETVNVGRVEMRIPYETAEQSITPKEMGRRAAEIIWRSQNDVWRVSDYTGDNLGHFELERRLRQAKSQDGALSLDLSTGGKPAGYSALAEIDIDNGVDISIYKRTPGDSNGLAKPIATGQSEARNGSVLAAINDLMRGLGLTPDSAPKKSTKKDPNRIVRFSRGRVPSQSEIDAEREAGSVDADKDRAGITTEKDETLREEKEFPIDSIRRREMTRQKVKDWYAEADERLNTPQKLAAETKRLLKIAKDHYASAYNERGRRTLTFKTETLEPSDVKLMQRVADFMNKAWEDSGRDPEIGADLNLLTMASKDLAGEHGRILNAHKNLSKSPADMARTMLRDLLLGPEEKQAAPVDAAVKLTGLESQTSLLKKKLVDKALVEIQTIAAQVTELREALKTPMPEMKPLQPAGKGPGKGPGAGKGSDPAQLSPAQAGQVLTGPGGKKITRRQAQAELNSLEDRLVRLLKVTKGMPPGKLSPEQRGALAVAEIARIKKDHGIDLASWTDADWEDTPQVLSLMRGLAADKATPMDRAYEWWLNAILSGISTQAVNVTSNLMFNIYEEGVRALRTGIKAASGSDAHDADADYLLSVWGGMARSIPRAWNNAVWAWSNEASKFGHDATKWDERQIRTAIHGKFGRVVRGFGVRQLLAGDEFFKTIIGEGEAAGNAYGIAKDEAAKKKLKPKSAEYNKFLEKRMREMIEDLASPAWTGEVTTEVNRRTFQADLHDVWQLVARARNMTPGARWIVPFITTPINVLIEGMRAVPLVDPAMEFTKATVKNKSAKAGLAAITNADTLARQSMSLAFLMFLVAGDEPDEKGMSMVEGPSEAGRNRALREWEVGMSKPQTIALPGTKNRLDYSRVEPAATAIGMTASLARNIRDAIAGRKQPSVAAASVMSAFWRQMQDKTMLKGLTDATRAFKPEEGDSTWGARMAQWVGRFAGSFVPKAATQWYVRPDDEIREGDLWGAKKTGDVDRESPLVKAGRNVRASLLPSEDNPRVDPWGVNVQRDSVSAGAADPFLTPFGIVRGSALSVREPGRGKPEMIKEIDDLFAQYNAKHPDDPLSPARPQKSIELRNKQGIKYKAYLTDDEYEEYSRLHGETRQEVFKSAMAALRKNVDILPDVLESANKAANEKAKAVWTRKLMTEKK